MRKQARNRYAALSVVTAMLMLAVLACTANDTLFITLTLTPTPTITPTPLPFTTKFKEGDELVVVVNGPFAKVDLADNAGPWSAAGSGGTNPAVCLPATRVTVSGVSRNISDANDSLIYYRVRCTGRDGWLPEYNVTNMAAGTKIVVKSADGTGATVYAQNDSTGRAQSEKCADGTSLSVGEVITGRARTDQNQYVQVTCGKLRGYILSTDVVLAN